MSSNDPLSESIEQLQSAHEQGEPADVLQRLIALLAEQGKYHEQFEALKMQLRARLGLPLLYGDVGDDLDPTARKQLEEGLVEACRTIGTSLLQGGKIREGWMYLRAVGDKPATRKLLANITPDDLNYEELIEVMLHQGVDVLAGFELTLDRYGTCNAITTFESIASSLSKPDRRAVGRRLLNHLHADLLENVKGEITQQEKKEPSGEWVADLLKDRPWLLSEGGCHVDTSHLATVVKHARLLDDAESWRLALDLAEYGRQLSPSLQHEGEEPFVDQFPSSACYFHALLGDDCETAVEFFHQRAEEVPAYTQGTIAAEVYVDLLARLGQYPKAIDALLQYLPPGTRTTNLAPTLSELCHRSGNYVPMLQEAKQQGDLLGFTMALLRASSEPEESASN